jgi:hypothetical protein
MAKRPKSKAKAAKAKRAKAGTFGQAMKALEGVNVPKQQFGKLNRDGTAEIDPRKLEELKKKLGRAASGVRFVALNAPFKRRAQIPPA